MAKKIKLSKDYVLKHIADRLSAIHDKLDEVDEALYNKDEVKENVHDLWYIIRHASLEIDELASAIRP